MKKQVLLYAKPAKDLRSGDRILTGRMVVAEVESAEAFEDATKRACIAVVARSGAHVVAATHFLADEVVLVVE